MAMRMKWRRSLKGHVGSKLRRPKNGTVRLLLEALEDRTLPTVSFVGAPNWFEQGPGPHINEGSSGITNAPQGNNPASGAIEAVAVDPSDANHVFVGTVDGGVWGTSNATASSPNWAPLTDQLPSLSFGAIAFDPQDASHNTVYAGAGDFTNGGGVQGPAAGLFKTTNDGASWVPVGNLAGQQIESVVPTTINTATGQVILVASNNGGVWRSADGGATPFKPISGAVGTGLPPGGATNLKGDPGNNMRFYAALPGIGVYLSNDGGATWAPTSNGQLANVGTTGRIEVATHSSAGNDVVYAGLINGGKLSNVYRSTDQGTTWVQLGTAPAINKLGQGFPNFAIVADPTQPNIVFVSGDASATTINAAVFRGDSSTNTWTSVTDAGANNSSPHSDSRDMVFDKNGNIDYTSDGGIYRLVDPNNTIPNRHWDSVIGNLRVSEFYSLAYDYVHHQVFGGAQDTSSSADPSLGNFTWNSISGGDGAMAQFGSDGLQYASAQNLGGFNRSGTGIKLNINNAPGNTLTKTAPAPPNPPGTFVFDTTIQFVNPYAIDAVDPSRMLIGTSFLYESSDRGDDLTSLGGVNNLNMDGIDNDLDGGIDEGDEFSPANPIGAVSTIAYGGRSGGVNNADVAYVGTSGGGFFGAGNFLLLRTKVATPGSPVLADFSTVAAYPGGVPRSIVLDPDDWHAGYLVDSGNQVWRFVNAGATAADWTNITTNLGSLTSSVNSVTMFSPTANFLRPSDPVVIGDDVVVVGAAGGVYRAILNPSSLATTIWTKFNNALPALGANPPQPNNQASALADVSVSDLRYNFQDDILTAGTYGRGAWTVPNASTVLLTASVLIVNGDENFPGEDDTFVLKLNSANPLLLDVFVNGIMEFEGSLAALQQIEVNGLGGNDTLIVDSTNGLINVPLGIRYDGGTGFNTLQLVQTGGTIQTTDVYSPGPNPGEGKDVITGPSGTQTVFFQNLAPVLDTVVATTATINATPADNAINYTTGSVPANGLVTIDNQESYEFSNKDFLVINGLAGNDIINLNNPSLPTGATPGGLGAITVNGGDPTDTDTLIVNGTGTVNVATDTNTITGAGPVSISYATIESLIVNAANNSLTVSGSNTYTYTPGAAADAGTVQTVTLPIAFTGVGAGKTLTLTGSGGGATVTANGTNGNDSFTLAATTGAITLGGALAGRATIAPTSIASLIVNGLDGDDAFSVTGPQPYTNITLAGGDPSASDVANLTGNGTAVVAHLGGATASVTGGGLGNVSLPGIEVVNLNAGAGSITLAGTSGPDAFTVTPTGANTATAQVGSLSPVVNGTTTSTLTVDADGGNDTLTVNGTSAGDTINVSGAAVTVVGLQAVNFVNVESLGVNGLAGSDTFNVTSSATVPISIDGGDPVGVLPGDTLNVVTIPGDMVNLFPGPTTDSGGVVVNSNQPISYVHIESLTITGGGSPIINGTNGNDVITIIARDSSYAPGLDGIQDFTVSVNAGPNILFIDTPSLTVHALAGDDQIVVQAPAPNLAAWNVALTLDGGPSSALGDQLVVSTPGANQATYTPSTANSGTLGVTNSNGNVTGVTITDIESFIYDGQAGGDSLKMVGSSAANAFTLTPGATNDAGTLSMDSTLPVSFQNLGIGGQVVVDGNGGADTLTYNGTPANDTFVVDNSALGGQINLNARVPLLTANISNVSLLGLGGDDTFTQVPTILSGPYLMLRLVGGPPASATGSQANLKATAGTPITLSGQVIKQGAFTVAGSGLQNENLNGAGDDTTYNSVVGVTENINVIASPTANQGQVSVPGVAQWTFSNIPIIYVNGTAADSDTVTFTGTNNNDVFQINLAAAGTDADPVLKLQTPGGSTLLTLGNYTGFKTLNITGLDGADVFNVLVAPTGPGRQIFINGELPSGKKKLTDTLNVIYVKPRPKIVQSISTQDHDAGLVSADYGPGLPFYLIQFDGIENVTIRQQ
jgi:hypothetical protein